MSLLTREMAFALGLDADGSGTFQEEMLMSMPVGGIGGTIASGVLLRRGKRDRDWLRQAHYATPRRAQWDLARSRLVF